MGHFMAAIHTTASTSSVTFGEIIVLVSLILVGLGVFLGSRIKNTFLGIFVQLVLTLLAGVLIAAAYPHKLLVPLYHISGGKLGIPA